MSNTEDHNLPDEEDVKEAPIPLAELEPHVFSPLNLEIQESRFLVLKPHNGNKNSMLDCSFSCEPLSSCTPYTYVVNTRGNPFASAIIPIDGYGKKISYNIGVFLHHIRTPSTPLRLWFRDLCVDHQDPTERAAYWNPEWMDTMSSHAKQIIDLSEIMATLWDKGELPRPYQPRPKDYINVRSGDNFQTKHHPMPLGSFRGHDAPPFPHKYLPLDYCADEIRLVSLFSGESHDVPLMAMLAYAPMHGDTGYTCLSYTWGIEDASCDLLLTGQSFLIRPSLDAFLRAARSEEYRYTFWIDAMCIDQSNIGEKNRQIPRMLEIYEAADVVLSWAGEPDAISDVALELIRTPEFKQPTLRQRADGEWNVANPETLPARLAALYRFFQRPYFRRIWVIQELAAASHPTLMVGKEMVEWRVIDFAAYHMNDILHRDVSMAAKMMAADGELKKIEDYELAYVRKLFYFRHLRVKGGEELYAPYRTGWAEIRDTSPGILDACILARDFDSTSPHDKIFAVWNLAQDVEGVLSSPEAEYSFKLDYGVPLAEMYTQFVVAVTKHTGSLDIICAAERQRTEGLGLEEMPSWVPDWTMRSRVSSMVRREHIPNRLMKVVNDIGGSVYHACSLEPIPASAPEIKVRRFEFATTGGGEGMRLQVAGLLIDKIKILGPPIFDLGSEDRGILAQWLSLVAEHCDDATSDMSEKDKLYQKQFWSMVAGEVTGVWGIEQIPNEEGQEWLRTVCLVPEDEAEGKKDENGKRGKLGRRHGLMNTSVDIHRVITRGRRVAVTEGDYMGLVPWDAEVGMTLAVLNSCSSPVILEIDTEEKSSDGGADRYKYVGSAFVQGWMEGEMIRPYGETDEEAWETIDAFGRITVI